MTSRKASIWLFISLGLLLVERGHAAPSPRAAVSGQGSVREIVAPQELSAIKVFDWGLRRQGSRFFGIYGRLLKTVKPHMPMKRPQGNPSFTDQQPHPISWTWTWAYRGQATQTVTWLTSRPLSLQELRGGPPLEASDAPHAEEGSISSLYQDVNPPKQLDELSELYLSIKESVEVNPEPLTGANGYHLEEWRIFKASPPYQLVSFSYKRVENSPNNQAESESAVAIQWVNHQWRATLYPSSKVQLIDAEPPTETLHSRLWDNVPYHVGGGYLSSSSHLSPLSLLKGEISKGEIELRIVDRRFERLGGTWSERVEWSIPHFLGANHARVVTDKHRMIRSISLDNGLFAIERPPPQVRKREALDYKLRPLSLERLQAQSGRLPPTVFKKMTEMAKPQLSPCSRHADLNQNTSSFLHIVLRLSLSSQGRLIAAGATHQLPWKQTKCLLKAVQHLRFPPPRSPLRNLAKGAYKNHGQTFKPGDQGAMLAWPLTFSTSSTD